jgi:hypothetical protein
VIKEEALYYILCMGSFFLHDRSKPLFKWYKLYNKKNISSKKKLKKKKKYRHMFCYVLYRPYLVTEKLWYSGKKNILNYRLVKKKSTITYLKNNENYIDSLVNDFNKKI